MTRIAPTMQIREAFIVKYYSWKLTWMSMQLPFWYIFQFDIVHFFFWLYILRLPSIKLGCNGHKMSEQVGGVCTRINTKHIIATSKIVFHPYSHLNLLVIFYLLKAALLCFLFNYYYAGRGVHWPSGATTKTIVRVNAFSHGST